MLNKHFLYWVKWSLPSGLLGAQRGGNGVLLSFRRLSEWVKWEGKDLYREVIGGSGNPQNIAEEEHFAEEKRGLGGPWRCSGLKKSTK